MKSFKTHIKEDSTHDNLISGKDALEEFLFSKGVKDITVKTFRDEITFTLPDGSKVVVEVKNYIQKT